MGRLSHDWFLLYCSGEDAASYRGNVGVTRGSFFCDVESVAKFDLESGDPW